MERVIVIGGSGFIGRALQQHVLDERMENAFVFTYNNHPERICDSLEKERVNLFEKDSIRVIRKYSRAIYVSGSSNHGFVKSYPSLDLDFNVKTFLNFMEGFRGSFITLSSQAVYYGLEGEIDEDVGHISIIPYGLSKQMTETYARYFLKKGILSKLWIFRLMYAFGKNEKERRLIPRCAKATCSNEKVVVYGGGRSFLNPLPSWFVAKVLIEASNNLEEKDESFLEMTNMNYPEKVTVSDIVAFLEDVKHFGYIINEFGEEWPIRFWGNTKNLVTHMKEWNIAFPNLWNNLRKYFMKLVGEKRNTTEISSRREL